MHIHHGGHLFQHLAHFLGKWGKLNCEQAWVGAEQAIREKLCPVPLQISLFFVYPCFHFVPTPHWWGQGCITRHGDKQVYTTSWHILPPLCTMTWRSAIMHDMLHMSSNLCTSSVLTVPTVVPMSIMVAMTFQKSSLHASSTCVQAAAGFDIACSSSSHPCSSSSPPSPLSVLQEKGGWKYVHASRCQTIHPSVHTDDFLWHMERVRSALTTLVSFVLVMNVGPSSMMRVVIMQSAQMGPCAVDIRSCMPSMVKCTVLFLHQHHIKKSTLNDVSLLHLFLLTYPAPMHYVSYLFILSLCVFMYATCPCPSLPISACLHLCLPASAWLCLTLSASTHLCLPLPAFSWLHASTCVCPCLPTSTCLCLPLPTSACLCLPLPASTCICPPLPMSAHLHLPPPTAAHLPAAAHFCPPLPTSACLCLCLPTSACLHLPPPTTACLHLPLLTSTHLCLCLPMSACLHLCLPTSAYVCLPLPMSACLRPPLPTSTWVWPCLPGAVFSGIPANFYIFLWWELGKITYISCFWLRQKGL